MIGAEGSSTSVGSPEPNVSYAIRTPSPDVTVAATSGSGARIARRLDRLDEVADEQVDADRITGVHDVAAALDEHETCMRDRAGEAARLRHVADALVGALDHERRGADSGAHARDRVEIHRRWRPERGGK